MDDEQRRKISEIMARTHLKTDLPQSLRDIGEILGWEYAAWYLKVGYDFQKSLEESNAYNTVSRKSNENDHGTGVSHIRRKRG